MYIEAKAVSTFIQLGMNIAIMAVMGGEMRQQGREITQNITNPINAEKGKI